MKTIFLRGTTTISVIVPSECAEVVKAVLEKWGYRPVAHEYQGLSQLEWFTDYAGDCGEDTQKTLTDLRLPHSLQLYAHADDGEDIMEDSHTAYYRMKEGEYTESPKATPFTDEDTNFIQGICAEVLLTQ